MDFGESIARALQDAQERARLRSKSRDGRGRDSAEGTPSKRHRSLSSTRIGAPTESVSVADCCADGHPQRGRFSEECHLRGWSGNQGNVICGEREVTIEGWDGDRHRNASERDLRGQSA